MPKDTHPGVTIRHYQSRHNSVRNKIVLHQNMINILKRGRKTVIYPEGTTTVREGEFLVLSAGNCLTSEVISDNQDFASLILYFDNTVLTDFFVRHQQMLRADEMQERKLFLLYRQDDFIQHYVQSVEVLLSSGQFTPALQRVKIEELLLYLYQQSPQRFLSLMAKGPDSEEMQLRRVVENNIEHSVTVEELAFLCNASVSTFKRRFARVYGTSPQKFLVSRRMALAAALLSQAHERPGQVFQKVGYENHSSFSQAFKQQYGVTPREYHESQLNVRQH